MDLQLMEKFNKLLDDVAAIKGICKDCGVLKKKVQVALIKTNTENNSEQIRKLTRENVNLKRTVSELEHYSKKFNVHSR